MHHRPCRPLRRTLPAWLALVALVFAQLAVAAHACVTALAPVPQAGLAAPRLPAGGDGAVGLVTEAPSAAETLHPPCHDAVASASADEAGTAAHQHDNLCQAHCQYGSTTVDTSSGGVQAPQPATPPPLAGLVLPTPPATPALRAQRYAAALAPPPPPALLFGVLRI